MKREFFKSEYDCIVIGAALSGMAAALSLNNKGLKNILILERQNMPGGVTTSFVRGGVEFEASLHEITSVSSEKFPLGVRKFLENNHIYVNWLRSEEAYRYVEPGFSCTVHAGEGGNFEIPAHDIASAVGDPNDEIYDKLMVFFSDCKNVYQSVLGLSDGKLFSIDLISSHLDMLRSVGYSAEEVLDCYKFPPLVKRILSAYWCYLGNQPSDLPDILYSYIMTDYLGYGPYLCKNTSHELSLKMAEECASRGIQIEYNQEVDKILVRDKHVVGVRLKDGTEILSNYVVSGAYPQMVYNQMIEPHEAVPEKTFQIINSKSLSSTVFSVLMLLDKTCEELNLDTYMTFVAPHGMDFDLIMKSYHQDHDYQYLTCVCISQANPTCSPKGTCIYSITALPYPDSMKNITEDNYDAWKHQVARELIQEESDRLHVNLFDHIKEIEFITPVSIAHYCKSFQGCIYGFLSSQDDNIVARIMTHKEELVIPGLAFAGAHQYSGDGMGPAIINGIQASEDIYHQLMEDLPSALHKIVLPNGKK